ncbi:DNA mismatch repair endonuclease MutL [Paenisporosarcina sp. TG20]|uniref:DNA mismatch repair endonuclease MutL n=1 Tax=Paenisporosarcina sp. TG20 TaxID=1211706 RepID=UPI0002EA819C|nr:DNA mismatch repair endonuclease MutL [Paenisporosarcina sp. TG20]
MGHIYLMDETLSNKIAAGEVVERPASVVKELVENAIDAGSTSIDVNLEEAGLQVIQVTDNGSGMDEEDAMLSFSRHATSKISNEHDLFRIRTLGFRGEALASIASVSKVSLWTSDGVSSGTSLVLEGSHVKKQQAGALRKGTDIKVAQLFFNTPARLKYMKTIQTELGHTIDLLNRLALCNPSIAFKLSHGDQVLLHTNGRDDLQQVIAAIYGLSIAKKMIAFSGESADYRIHGYVSLPEITRASKNYITLLVNGRWVKHYGIQQSIVNAYHTFLPIGRYPLVILHIEADPYLTDVNVHPSKQQIRLSKEKELQQLVEETIRQSLRSVMRAPEIAEKPKKIITPSEQMDLWKSNSSQPTTKSPSESPPIATFNKTSETAMVKEPYEHQETFVPTIENMQAISTKEAFPELDIVGQIHGTYIVAQSVDGFYLIDQHAAQERIKYEFFREKVGDVQAIERQSLLIPLSMHYSADEALRLKEYTDKLEEIGIFLEEFGPTTFIVREHPVWFPNGFEEEIIKELIEQVLNNRKTDVKKLREEAAIMMSCKRSIKANHYLTKDDMSKLLIDLKQAEHPFTCPHGRPVIVHFSTYEIEKMFKRVM